MNTKSIVTLIIVSMLAIAAGYFYSNAPQFMKRTDQDTISISVIQHRIRNMANYEPIREQDISIIEFWERKANWRSLDVVYMLAWRSEPCYTVSLDCIELTPSEDDSSIASISYGDNAFAFEANICSRYEAIQGIGGSLNANKEEEMIHRTSELLQEYIEFKYKDTDLRDKAQDMSDVMLKTLIETIMINQFVVDTSREEV